MNLDDCSSPTVPSPASDDESSDPQLCSMNRKEIKTDSQRKRAVLTNQQAAEIFQLRLSFGILDSSRQHLFTSRSAQVSKIYGVSPKAVRDIWNMRTWRHATKHLWTLQDRLREGEKPSTIKPETSQPAPNDVSNQNVRSAGRPKGVKDSRPRKLRGTLLGCIASTGECYPDTPESISCHMQLAEELGIPVLSQTSSEPQDSTNQVKEHVEVKHEELLNRWFPFFLPLPVEIDSD